MPSKAIFPKTSNSFSDKNVRGRAKREILNRSPLPYRDNQSKILWLFGRFFQDTFVFLTKSFKLMVGEKISYKATLNTDKSNTISLIRTILKNDGRVAAAWLFGWMARDDEKPNSDLDIMNIYLQPYN